jgi:hypothetical protein
LGICIERPRAGSRIVKRLSVLLFCLVMRSAVLGALCSAPLSGQAPVITHRTQSVAVANGETWSSVRAAGTLADGRLVIVESESKSLYVIDRAGRVSPGFGRFGAGPGEFRVVGSTGVIADTIWAFDPILRRTTFFDAAGRLLRVVSIARPDTAALRAALPSTIRHGANLFGQLQPVGMTRDGLMIARPDVDPQRAFASGVRANPVLITRQDGHPVRTLVSLPQHPIVVRRAGAGQGNLVFQPWYLENPFLVPGPSGQVVAIVRHDYAARVIVVTRLETSGNRSTESRIPFVTEPWSRNAADSLAGALAPSLPGVQRADLAAALSLPPSRPPAVSGLLAADGRLWLQSMRGPAGTMWTITSSNGAVLGRVRIDPMTIPIAITSDGFWGIVFDADGVPAVHRFILRAL